MSSLRKLINSVSRPQKLFYLCLIMLSLMAAGCGYTTSSTLPSHLRTIHIDTFKNRIDYTKEGQRNIYLPLLEVEAHRATVDRFLFDGHLKIAPKDTADLVLSGELVAYERDVLRYTDNDDVQEYRIRVVVNLQMWDATKQEMFWTESGFSGEATYFLTGPNVSSEQDAVNDAVKDLGRRIVERTIEDW